QMRFNNILIVCVGNICRSPMTEAIFKLHLQQAQSPIKVSSAGIGALIGHPADPFVNEILREQKGIDCSAHRARQLNKEMLAESELILVMENVHCKKIKRQFPAACGKVHLLGNWSNFEIPDPYKMPKQFFVDIYHLILQGVEEWQTKLT
ncbi:MAG: hypothetical protein ACD_44C00104G0002, partial [uncultured bacterium]